jgi:hypothetical protein
VSELGREAERERVRERREREGRDCAEKGKGSEKRKGNKQGACLRKEPAEEGKGEGAD